MPQERMEPDPAFEDLIQHIQQTRGIDFRGYKRSSLRRRIQLRVQEVGAEDFLAYQDFLEGNPPEFAELLDTVLINVTSFFRDPDAWKALREQVVPDLARRAETRGQIRIWSVGCASGEEPFSIAMLLAEAMGGARFCERVKIYATDLDEGALRAARLASYGPRDVEGLEPALLDKYFERAGDNFVFQRDLRKCVIFGRHNVVVDAPISRIDLLICRNLMIYLEAATQNAVLPRLHYSLVEDGHLFLGKAETQLSRSNLFTATDMKHRIFAKVAHEWRRSPGGSLTADGYAHGGAELNAKVLESVIDASSAGYLVVDSRGVLVFANAAARRLLDVGEMDVGRMFHDLAISYRPSELRSRIDDALRDTRPVRMEHQEFHRPPHPPMRLSIEISPLPGADLKPFAALLSFTDTTRLFGLQTELQAAQESLETMIEELQSANEELETTNEELQSTNEELETTNEELQSTNEELETMNEELHSTNEQAEVSNEELRRQSDEASDYRAYSESILHSIDLGIAVLDDRLIVRSWNRWGEKILGVRAEDAIGEYLLDLDIGLPLGRLQDRLRAVASGSQEHSEIVLEGTDRRGRPLRCRVRLWPLTFVDRTRHGVVLTVDDVTADTQREAYTQHLGRILGQSLNEIYFLDPQSLRFTLVNRGAEQRLGYGIQQLRQLSLSDLMPQVQHAALTALIAPLLSGDRSEVVVETVIRSRQGHEYPAEICLQYYAQEEPPFLLAIVQDTTERQSLAQPQDNEATPRPSERDAGC